MQPHTVHSQTESDDGPVKVTSSHQTFYVTNSSGGGGGGKQLYSTPSDLHKKYTPHGYKPPHAGVSIFLLIFC